MHCRLDLEQAYSDAAKIESSGRNEVRRRLDFRACQHQRVLDRLFVETRHDGSILRQAEILPVRHDEGLGYCCGTAGPAAECVGGYSRIARTTVSRIGWSR